MGGLSSSCTSSGVTISKEDITVSSWGGEGKGEGDRELLGRRSRRGVGRVSQE